MRAFLIIFFSLVILEVFSQNFVSPGIIAYHSGAYERTIQDMNQAFQVNGNMDNSTKAKAHYYRGMARLALIKAGSNSQEIGNDPYLSVYNDLDQAMKLDGQWGQSSQAELGLIYQQLVSSSKNLYDLGINATSDRDIDRLLESAIEKLRIASTINDSFEANELLGLSHDALGTWYDQYLDQEAKQKKAVAAYESAVPFYERALEINPQSLSTVRALEQIAYRFGDREKQRYYANLAASIGG